MLFVCAQPCTPYYAWQVEVMLTNFFECGIHEQHTIHVVFTKENEHLLDKLRDKFSMVSFFVYEDTRKTKNYPSSIRPNLLKQHFKHFPQNITSVFYHDCDIVFTKYPDFLENLEFNNRTWYVSNCTSYISHNYIVSKGYDVLGNMCEIVGIHPCLVESKENESGGAQYIMTGVDWHFFDKVEVDSERLFTEITALNQTKKQANPNYHELQIWCADMWAVLWNGWMRGFKTEIIKELDFCWATDTPQRWHEVYIYHNAGVTENERNEIFFKADFQTKYPFLEGGEQYDTRRAAYKYFKIIKYIGADSCLLEDTIDEDFATLHTIRRANKRFKVCKSCVHFTKTNDTFMCKLCGCETEKKLLEAENLCPEKKWKS